MPHRLDNMTPKQTRDWVSILLSCTRQFEEIKATLIINCQRDRLLGQNGIIYDEKRTVLSNLISILRTLTEKIKDD